MGPEVFQRQVHTLGAGLTTYMYVSWLSSFPAQQNLQDARPIINLTYY